MYILLEEYKINKMLRSLEFYSIIKIWTLYNVENKTRMTTSVKRILNKLYNITNEYRVNKLCFQK